MTGPAPDADRDRASPADLPYQLNWRSAGVRIGAHRGKMDGAGGLFRDFDLLIRSPDPRRIDLRMSVRDPFGNLHVRRFEQKTSIVVYALVDLSASMGFADDVAKLDVAADLCAALATSARSIGDAFGLIGCDREIVPEFLLPATRARGSEMDMLAQLRHFVPRGRGAQGMVEAASYLAGRRKLVFVISDFHWPAALIEQLFEALSQHDVVPIVLKSAREASDLPRFGLVSLADLESGRRRLFAMRPALRAKWMRRQEEQARVLRDAATRYGRAPFEIVGPVDWERLQAYLLDEAA